MARVNPRSTCLLLALLLVPSPAFCHSFDGFDRELWFWAWNWDPFIIPQLLLMAWLYQRGVASIWRRVGQGHGHSYRQVIFFALGMIILALSLVSPIDPIGEELAYVHMLQHLMIMMLAAPLIVLGAPGPAWICGLPNQWRRRIWRLNRQISRWRWPFYLAWQPLVAWLLYAVIFWAWHIPALYLAALRFTLVHYLQHLMFFCVAYLFWRVVLDPISRSRMNQGLGVFYLFTTSLQGAALGSLMVFSREPWYIDYTISAPLWGKLPIEDQQLAGLIMWMPAGAMYAVIAVILLGFWLHEKGPSHGQPHPRKRLSS